MCFPKLRALPMLPSACDHYRHASHCLERVMRTVFSDLRYAIRQLLKDPGFMLTAVVSLALGIGATTAVFSVIYAALLNPFPYPGADRIVRMTLASKSSPDFGAQLNGPQVRQLREVPLIQSVLAMDYHRLTLTASPVQEHIFEVGLFGWSTSHRFWCGHKVLGPR
jgi:hypothetical protein